MKTTNVIKKMVAVGTGLAMVGATILGASATLDVYPAPFVKAGVPASNLGVFVGDEADASDVVGMGDILSALQQSAVVSVAGSGGTTSVLQGDVAEVGSAGDMLELGEELNEVRDSFTSGDVQALASGSVTTDEGSTDYNQYVNFNDASGGDNQADGAVIFGEDEDDQVGVFLFWDGGSEIFEYQLIFEEGFESEIDANLDLDDLEGEVLNILGNQLTVVDTDIGGTAASHDVTMDLMTGAAKLVMSEGETKTVTIDGKEFVVEIKVISETSNDGEGSVILIVNGEETDELDDGDTDVLADGSEVGIEDIIPTGKETQKSVVVLFVGAFKIEISDTDSDSAGGGRLEVNEEFIEDADVEITGTLSSDDGDDVPEEGEEYEINDIDIELNSDPADGSDLYVMPNMAPAEGYPSGESSVRALLDEPDGMLVPNWDIVFDGLTDTGTTEIKLNPSGDDEYKLEFVTQEGDEHNIDYLSAEADPGAITDDDGGGLVQGFATGDDSDRLHWQEPEVEVNGAAGITAGTADFANDRAADATGETNDFVITIDDWFVVSDCTAADNTCNTHVLRYDNFDEDNRQLTFSDLAGGTREITFTEVDDAGDGDAVANVDFGYSEQLIVGGDTYNVWVATDAGGTDPTVEGQIVVDLNGDGNLEAGDKAYVGVKGLGVLDLGEYCSADSSGIAAADGAFDANGDGTIDDTADDGGAPAAEANAADCGVKDGGAGDEGADAEGEEEYDPTKFPTANAGTGASDAQENYLGIVTLDEEFDEGAPEDGAAADMVVYAQIIGRANDEIGISGITDDLPAALEGGLLYAFDDPQAGLTTLMGPESPEEDDDLDIYWDTYGVEYRLRDEEGTDDAETLTINYPLGQRAANVYLTFGEALSTSVAGGNQQINPIPVGASKLASEVSDITAFNAIVVGGPCANPLSAQLMGNPEPCWEAIPENKALVKLYEHSNGNMALLVAGRSAMNTRQGARALATGDITSAGAVKEAFVSGSSLTDVMISAV